MEQIPSYNLLQAIDPTKIKVPISERFAKLTLSSNKKKQQQEEQLPNETEDQQQKVLKKQQNKRDSVSRDISKQFEIENKENQKKLQENPLLRSESSKDTQCLDSLSSKEEVEEEEMTMDPLEVSQDYDNPTQLGDDMELLSLQIASMVVDNKPISLSSDSNENLSEINQFLTGSESQRSSTSDIDRIHIVHNIPLNMEDAARRNTMHINLDTSGNHSKNNVKIEKSYEMTDDEDRVQKELEVEEEEEEEDYDDDEEKAITISDTSESHHEEQHPDIMATSSLPSTSMTSDLILPTQTDDKAERLAAFLRDVSLEGRARAEMGQLIFNDTVDHLLDNKEIDKIQESLAKSKEIAAADTESMTPDGEEDIIPQALLEREKRLKALEENEENNSEILTEDEENIKKTDNNIHRLANDETQDNTVISDLDENNQKEKTPTIQSYPRNTFTPNKTNQDTNAYRMVNDETQCNTELSLNEENMETPKIAKTLQQINKENGKRFLQMETEANTEYSLKDDCNQSSSKTKIDNPHRLINDDTIANSLLTDIQQQSLVYNYTQDYTTPQKVGNTITNNETINNSSISIHSTPVSSKNSLHKENSFNSVINSSTEHNATAPEHSITILETDDEVESVQEKSCTNSVENSDDNKKLSNSFHREDSSSDDSEYDEQISKIQMSMASINISAKINIKIHIPNTTSTETSEDDQQYDNDNRDARITKQLIGVSKKNDTEEKSLSNDNSIESNEQSMLSNDQGNPSNDQSLQSNDHSLQSNDHSTASTDHSMKSDKAEKPCHQLKLKVPEERMIYSPNKTSITQNNLSSHSPQKTSDSSINKPFDSYRNKFSNSPNKSSDSQHDKSPDSSNKSSDSVEIVEDPKFLTDAQKLLNQLYGNSWQTPDVIRTLKRSSQSGEKKTQINSKSSSRKKNDIKNSNESKTNDKSKVEESMLLDDFSIFRRNIVKTNLDSTRLATPPNAATQNKEISTEPRNNKKPLIQKENSANKRIPQTEKKPLQPPVAKVVINKGRADNGRWRQLIDNDSNSEGDNASDDDDADESWSKNASEIEKDITDSDFEISPKPKTRNRKNTTTAKGRQGRSNKSDILTKKLNKSKAGEIVYLDLSKEEVEVQDEVPGSPPANHDVTFASRLQDILKTCRHEDKAKLPSSTKKTKRKLFNPNFGDDDFESAGTNENEEKTKAINNKNNNSVQEELLDDNGICPFDSHGRPKVLDLFNKQLESVKTGKPIFQLTPSPKKTPKTPLSTKNDKNTKPTTSANTPKTKVDNEVKFKTPSTIRSKLPPKSMQELSQTPDYKYSFLKSLDVTVSKAFCHPDALYYRDNYRLKKEDLSKILYDMYNEKLFTNKLNVPITWNKKLSNTAGRCLNKKRMGLRSSVIELSDKVLTSADRLRCTLIHELCHAATWIFDGEGGHGSTWKEWARRANATFPEIPKIGVCHQYDIEYKYTYKCTLCAAKSHAHSKSKKVENIRCSYCHGAIEIFLNKKDKDGNVIPTPVKEPTGFAKFVKDNYKKFKRDDLKHADVMKLLSSEFASLKVNAS